MDDEKIAISLRVVNQPEGCDDDRTSDYLRLVIDGWNPREGAILDIDQHTLTGPSGPTWRTFVELRLLVCVTGHGSEELDDSCPPPRLAACPLDFIDPTGYETSTAELAWVESANQRKYETWSEFRAIFSEHAWGTRERAETT